MRTRLATLFVALLTVAVVPLLAVPTASADDAAQRAGASGRVRGEILGAAGAGTPRVRLTWFTRDWKQLGSRRFDGGGYSLTLRPGVYRLQFTDVRPAYDVKRYAPTDAVVKVEVGNTTVRSVRMRRGAAIGGTVRAGGRVAPNARIVAANKDQRSWETRADSRGRFALGGLPEGTYSIFTYDARRTWVGPSTYFRKLLAGKYRAMSIGLNRRAGTFIVDLYAGGQQYRGPRVYPTIVSRATGQFWTAASSRGTVTFRGLFPGKYRIVVPSLGNYFGATRSLTAAVREGRAAFGGVRLTRRGAWVTGTVVDENRPENALKGAQVRLVDADGRTLDSTTANDSGRFLLDGLLTTQQGLRVVVGPQPGNPYLGEGVSYCKYKATRFAPVSVTTGQRTEVGAVGVAHLPDGQQDGAQCHTPAPTTPRGSR